MATLELRVVNAVASVMDNLVVINTAKTPQEFDEQVGKLIIEALKKDRIKVVEETIPPWAKDPSGRWG